MCQFFQRFPYVIVHTIVFCETHESCSLTIRIRSIVTDWLNDLVGSPIA